MSYGADTTNYTKVDVEEATVDTATVTTLNFTTVNVTTANVTTANVTTLDGVTVQADNLQITATGVTNVSKIAKLSLTSEQILALRATPITIVAAPGAGKVNLPIRCIFEYTFVTTAYTVVNATLALRMNGITLGSSIAGTVFLNGANSLIYTMPTPDVVPATNPTTLVNQDMKIENIGAAEALLGDGTLEITLFYDTFTV